MLRLIAVLTFPALVLAHGALERPAPRNAGINTTTDENVLGCTPNGLGSCMWFSQGCNPGCRECSGVNNLEAYYDSNCDEPMEPTISDPALRTMFINEPSGDESDLYRYRPWRAPGHSPVIDSCGVAGGTPIGPNVDAGGIPPPGYSYGDKGSALPPINEKTTWRRGEAAEVRFGISANHGGGYAYRLCPAAATLDEACFNLHHLDFATSTQRLRWSNGTEVTINATRVNVGTFPAGAVWTKNPVPPCLSRSAGREEEGCDAPQFEPPPGCNERCWGYQSGVSTQPGVIVETEREIPSIVDEVLVPHDLTPGAWVLAWRWDSEHTSQVWGSCADIDIM